MFECLRWFSPDPQAFYPGMQAAESLLIDEFLVRNPYKINRIAYNVPLCRPLPFNPSQPRSSLRNWSYLTALKLDALADNGEFYHLIECKVSVNWHAFYQITSYVTQFKMLYPEITKLVPILLCEFCPPDFDYHFLQSGITILRVKRFDEQNPTRPPNSEAF